MKYLIITIISLCAASTAAWAQTEDKTVKKIEVTGRAEQEIVPDEIYFNITLKEYLADNKEKVGIDKLERELQNAVKKVGIEAENLQIQNISSYNYWYWKQKKAKDFLASKQYRIKLSELGMINQLLEYLDPKGIQSTNIAEYSHSEIEKYRKDLKIKALQAAKEKATYMVESIGEQLGGVLEIQEIGDGYQPPMPYARNAKVMMMSEAQEDMAVAEDIDFQTIKLQYEVRASFRIQ